MRPPALRAHQLRSVGPGQRWLVELELTPDGKIRQRINEGTPDPPGSWKTIGSWTDAEAERNRLAAAGWVIES
jgi:hypothetical protein